MSIDRDRLWRSNWVWNALWHIQYMMVLLIIAVLWRPTANNTRYTCSESAEEVSDVELVALQPLEGYRLQVMGLGDITKRKKEDDKWRETSGSLNIPVSVSLGGSSIQFLEKVDHLEELEPTKLE